MNTYNFNIARVPRECVDSKLIPQWASPIGENSMFRGLKLRKAMECYLSL